ncbi:MAG: Type II secretion system protein E [Myxococcota bacterium]|nr:Type II secretion system protein E [Myxococcota bacterium]
MATPQRPSNNRLGELLIRENLITPQQLNKAMQLQKERGGRIGFHLTEMGAIDEEKLTNFLSKQYNIPPIDLQQFDIDKDIIKLVPRDVAEKHMVLPVNRAGQSLILAMSDPSNIYAIDDIKFLTGYNVEPVVASEAAIRRAIGQYYGGRSGASSAMGSSVSVAQAAANIPDGPNALEQDVSYDDILGTFDDSDVEVADVGEDEGSIVDLQRASEDAPVVRLVNLILVDSIKKGASDIHVEPYEKEFRVRFRIDGVLQEVMRPPMKLKNAITSRMKIMSNMDIAERRLPQDGRIKLKLGKGKEMDYRVNVCPTLFGEKICLRLLDKSNLQLDMTKLGFEPKPLEEFLHAIHKPFGMVLVTGPTGSGKTTTLYSALSELNKVTENISTAEDPVEFNFAGINQVQMHESIGLNFAAALRAFLRQDPDIIMVGEIRDFETAEIGIKAALTGHLVLSTLHTNDAPSTVGRLLNMGIEPFMVAASINLILAQRLARRICKDCKTPDPSVTVQDLISLQVPREKAEKAQIMKGKGCDTCNGKGLKGRVALYEVMTMYDELKEMVINGASVAEIKVGAIKLGLQTLRMSAINKLLDGVTVPDEVVRCTIAD